VEVPELRDNPPYLLGKRFFENSNVDSTIVPAATANNYVLLYGDVRAAFTIVDRIGTTIELIPNLVGANQRPTGQRGALLWFRTGSEVVVPQAMRMLDVPTTAWFLVLGGRAGGFSDDSFRPVCRASDRSASRSSRARWGGCASQRAEDVLTQDRRRTAESIDMRGVVWL
jgi:hypothetical protein